MSWVNGLIGLFTGETSEEIEAGFQETRNDFFGEYPAAELHRMEQEDTANYVHNISAEPMRRVSYNEADTIMFWEEYVVDQKGREHVIASGQTPIMAGMPAEIVYGEAVEEVPIYLELMEVDDVRS